MRLLFPDDDLVCMPITVATGDSEHGARLGGKPPEGLIPANRTEKSRFFATLPLAADGEIEVSVFLSFAFDQMAEASRRVLGPANDLIEVVVHEKRPRATRATDLVSELSPHPLVIHGVSPDWFITGGARKIEPGHKIGGRPYVEQPRSSMLNEMQATMSAGFRQFAQIGFPSGQHDAPVAGDWPFADGVFHLLVKQDEAECLEWRWMWEF